MLPIPVVVELALVLVVVVARLATVGELVPWLADGEPAPFGGPEALHAASPIAAAARRAAGLPDRR
ncbi:MAG: hypothetical protein ABSD97_03680 [Acidimicrobiales bacterium]